MSSSFFASHLGQWVLRTDPCDSAPRTFYIPNDYKWVQYLHDLQTVGVKFAPLLVIHSSESTCVSCEG